METVSAPNVTDSAGGAAVRKTFPNPEPKPIPFAQKAQSAFDSGRVTPPEYRPDPFATNASAWWSRREFGWEYKPAEARVTGSPYQPPRPKCACCNAELEPARSDARFCGSACRQKAYRQRKAATAA